LVVVPTPAADPTAPRKQGAGETRGREGESSWIAATSSVAEELEKYRR
jgi:hypothetical protein